MKYISLIVPICRIQITGYTLDPLITAMMQFRKQKNIIHNPTAAITARRNAIQHDNQASSICSFISENC